MNNDIIMVLINTLKSLKYKLKFDLIFLKNTNLKYIQIAYIWNMIINELLTQIENFPALHRSQDI